MADVYAKVRKGEIRPVVVQETASSGTLTLGAPRVTLYDSSGAVVVGFNNIVATGYDVGALAAPRVWFNLDTTGLAAGLYTLVFSFTALGSDGITRTYQPTAVVNVMALLD